VVDGTHCQLAFVCMKNTMHGRFFHGNSTVFLQVGRLLEGKTSVRASFQCESLWILHKAAERRLG